MTNIKMIVNQNKNQIFHWNDKNDKKKEIVEENRIWTKFIWDLPLVVEFFSRAPFQVRRRLCQYLMLLGVQNIQSALLVGSIKWTKIITFSLWVKQEKYTVCHWRTCSMTKVEILKNISRTSTSDRSTFSNSECRTSKSRNLFRSDAACSSS